MSNEHLNWQDYIDISSGIKGKDREVLTNIVSEYANSSAGQEWLESIKAQKADYTQRGYDVRKVNITEDTLDGNSKPAQTSAKFTIFKNILAPSININPNQSLFAVNEKGEFVPFNTVNEQTLAHEGAHIADCNILDAQIKLYLANKDEIAYQNIEEYLQNPSLMTPEIEKNFKPEERLFGISAAITTITSNSARSLRVSRIPAKPNTKPHDTKARNWRSLPRTRFSIQKISARKTRICWRWERKRSNTSIKTTTARLTQARFRHWNYIFRTMPTNMIRVLLKMPKRPSRPLNRIRPTRRA